MKKMNLWSIIMLVVMALPLMMACSSDDDNGPSGDALKSQAIGLWMCTESTDEYGGKAYNGLMVGKEVHIMSNNTYTSTSSTFGYTGTYTLSGNTITAKSSAGTFVVNVRIVGERMYWDGTASNGTKFNYTFQREIDEGTVSVSPPSGGYDPQTATYGPLTLSPSGSHIIGDAEGTFTVKVSTNPNASWHVALNNSNSINCSVSPTSGKGDGVVYIKYPARKSNNGEMATIIFYYKGYGNVDQNEVISLIRRTKGF